jgi:hypothetical protein
MISDILAAAVHQIDAYLSDPTFPEIYQGDVLTCIRLVRHAMDDLRQELETTPTSDAVDAYLRACGYDPDKVADRMQAAANRALEKVRQEFEEVADTQMPPSGYITISERIIDNCLWGQSAWHLNLETAIQDAETRWRHGGRDWHHITVKVLALNCLRVVWRSLSRDETETTELTDTQTPPRGELFEEK